MRGMIGRGKVVHQLLAINHLGQALALCGAEGTVRRVSGAVTCKTCKRARRE